MNPNPSDDVDHPLTILNRQFSKAIAHLSANPITQSAIITFDDEKTDYGEIKDTLIRDRVYIVGEPEYLK